MKWCSCLPSLGLIQHTQVKNERAVNKYPGRKSEKQKNSSQHFKMNTGIDAIKGHMINEFEKRPKKNDQQNTLADESEYVQ